MTGWNNAMFIGVSDNAGNGHRINALEPEHFGLEISH
jgi:hypothetical protein